MLKWIHVERSIVCTNNILTGCLAGHLQRLITRLFMGRGRLRCSSCAATVFILLNSYNGWCSLARETEIIIKQLKPGWSKTVVISFHCELTIFEEEPLFASKMSVISPTTPVDFTRYATMINVILLCRWSSWMSHQIQTFCLRIQS